MFKTLGFLLIKQLEGFFVKGQLKNLLTVLFMGQPVHRSFSVGVNLGVGLLVSFLIPKLALKSPNQ